MGHPVKKLEKTHLSVVKEKTKLRLVKEERKSKPAGVGACWCPGIGKMVVEISAFPLGGC